MDLQSLFYIVGIVFMVTMISLVFFAAYFISKVQRKIQTAQMEMKRKADEIKSKANGQMAGTAGRMVTAFILSRIKSAFQKKNEE